MTQSDLNPGHYTSSMTIKGVQIEPADIIEARFVDDAHLAMAAKYLLRAGLKAESSYIKDVGKCLWWCARAIMFRKGTFELPPGVTSKICPQIPPARKRPLPK